MNINNIESKLTKQISKILCIDIEELSLDLDLLYICIYDYMEFAEIIMSIEETFNISLEDYDVDDIKSIRQIANIIKEKNEA